MNESERIAATLKRLLKRGGYTYRRIAVELSLSEATIKRMFSRESFTLSRLLQLTSLLGISLSELASLAEESNSSITTLTPAQEKELVSEPALLLVAACVLNGWKPDEITQIYRLTKAECLKRLLKLDKLGLIRLLPGDRVRLNVARDFDWLPDGPIQRFFRGAERQDFLESDFAQPGESFFFLYGALTGATRARLQVRLQKLREEFAELHRESQASPSEQREGACLLLALRKWEPKRFAEMRRDRR